MPAKTRFDLQEEDLLGFSLDDVGCKNCSDMCSFKTARLYGGRPIIICANKEPGRTVLANFKPRR